MKSTITQTQYSRAAPSAPQHSSSLTASSNASSTSSFTSTVSTSSVTSQSTATTPPTTPLLPFYWNAANPQQPQHHHHQQQQLLLQQTEETPKIRNHSKRRYSDTSSSSPIMQLDRTESTSSLDCQSLQRSLKRVRLSSSPGELRLQLDLRQLVQGHEWIKTAEDVWHWPRTQCRLEQSQVDPLRLVFFVPGRNATTTRLWIQIPRMYPHRPPSITQIQHVNATSTLGAPTVSPFVKIQAIHITTEAPLGTKPDSDCCCAGPLQTRLDATQTVLTAGPWTCILRLTDVLEFLYQEFGDDPWSTAPAMPDARGFLAPNRFDLGYYKGNVNAMDLKE